MHWLTEGPSTAYLLLAVGAAVLIAAWYRTGRRGFLAAAGVCAAGIGLLALSDFAFESDREQIGGAVRSMAAAVGKSDLGPIFTHVSPSFRYAAADRDGFRRFCDTIHKTRRVTGMTVWDVEYGPVSRADRRGEVAFRFKVRGDWGGDTEFYLCRAVFVLDADDRWRMQSFRVFNPIVESTTPIAIPGLGR